MTWTIRQVRDDPVRFNKADGGIVVVVSGKCFSNGSACATLSIVKKSDWVTGDGHASELTDLVCIDHMVVQ